MAFTLEASSVKLLVDKDHFSFTRHSKKLPAWTNNAPEMWRKLWISITPWLLAALAWLWGACWPSNIVFVQLNKTQTALSALVWGWHQCVVAVVRREAGASICCPSPLPPLLLLCCSHPSRTEEGGHPSSPPSPTGQLNFLSLLTFSADRSQRQAFWKSELKNNLVPSDKSEAARPS